MLLGRLGILGYYFFVRLVSGKNASVLEAWFGFRERNSAAGAHLGFRSMRPLQRICKGVKDS